jgi:5-methylcytosine-specific restriction endonuclease McrA
MSFNPKSEYTIVPTEFNIKDFHDYKEDYVTRPPYQRKAVWSRAKKQSLMDSLFRRYYIPKLVIREVRLSDDRAINEIIDGQQRINTVQGFFNNEYSLPKSLEDISNELAGKYYKDLSVEIKKYLGKSLKYQADVIKSIDEPDNVKHQIIATEIFWRLQQGETLNYMEVAHAQLSSLTRNFIVKYSDDQTFDYSKYEPVDSNPDKLKFFSLLNVDNNRMKHLQFMARFAMIELGDGYADLSDRKIEDFINDFKTDNGIGDYSYENETTSQEVLKNLRNFYDIFKDDPMLDKNTGIKELSVEYFIISIYLLIRHIRRNYVVDEKMKETLRNFIYYFHERWKTYDETTDTDLLSFSNHRQQGENDLALRDRIVRQIFFEYLKDKGINIIEKDEKRAFSELERIIIYRNGKGLCQECLREGKPEKEAQVSWTQYQADHVFPHSKGGKTILENGELLCRYHNQSKSNKIK